MITLVSIIAIWLLSGMHIDSLNIDREFEHDTWSAAAARQREHSHAKIFKKFQKLTDWQLHIDSLTVDIQTSWKNFQLI